VNFTTALPDANYSVTGVATYSATTDGSINLGVAGTNNQTTAAVKVRTYLSTNEVVYDSAMVSVQIFR